MNFYVFVSHVISKRSYQYGLMYTVSLRYLPIYTTESTDENCQQMVTYFIVANANGIHLDDHDKGCQKYTQLSHRSMF